MNTIKFEKFKIMGADLGEYSCLPDIKNDDYIHASISVSEKITAEDRENIGKGMIPTLLPYRIQNGYNRKRRELALNAAWLENEYLRAVFVPQLGGRLWSLFDKTANRELLYSNDVFQPANLALRNAWFSGGVEWNMGIRGHNPLTCSPLFAEECKDKEGNPMLRMYEFERIREAVYCITAMLKEDVLLINITLENTSDQDKYMYWWSNIAVDETPGTRIITPAMESLYCSYMEGGYLLDMTDLPYIEGVDVTYPTNLMQSRDFFYRIPKDEKKWIAAVKEDGYGLIHLSTNELKGRKLFTWGQGKGGRHWNQWLSDCGKSYVEIQAGLMRTQMEHFVMKASSRISWTEGYSAIRTDPASIHGKDYPTAVHEVKKHILSKQNIVEHTDMAVANTCGLKYMGSGWGAVQSLLNQNPVSQTVTFPAEAAEEEEQQWLFLLENGELPIPDVQAPVKSYVKGEKWLSLLKSIPDSWYKHYQIGVVYYESGDTAAAYEAFQKSAAIKPNAWSFRNIAQIEKNEYGHMDLAVEYMEMAISEKNDYRPLWINYAETLVAAEEYHLWTNAYENRLPDNLKSDGRLKMLYSLCLSKSGRYQDALSILNNRFIMPDIKEGEFSISHIWLDIHRQIIAENESGIPTDEEIYRKYPLPYELDFRMH